MLKDFAVHPSLATSSAERAKRWYADKLGWQPTREFPRILIYTVEGTVLTVYETAYAGTAKNTVASWVVEDLRAEMARLRARGVQFDDFDLPDLHTEDGVMTDDVGGLGAWFRDSDGNYFALVEVHPTAEVPIPSQPGVHLSLAASDLGRARDWYETHLGLVPAHEFPGELLLYETGGSRFSIYPTPSAGTARNTVGMWWVADLRAEMADLRSRGVRFEDYDFGELKTVDGVLTDPDGDMTAWFTDSEGNILGLGQYREAFSAPSPS